MKKTAKLALLALVALSLAPFAQANSVYRPGLMQVLFKAGSVNGFPVTQNGLPVLASNIVEKAASDEKADPRVERVLYPLMDRNNGVQNVLTGSTWSWPDSFAVFAYEGELFVEAGTTYTCYGRFDDGSAMVIDGVTTLWQGGGSGYNGQPTIWGDYVAEKTGWVPFNAWIYDWSGGKAPRDCAYALQYNTNDVRTSFADSAQWSRFSDPGNMTSLRAVSHEAWTSVAKLEVAGDDLVVTIRTDGLPAAGTATVFAGAADGGTVPDAWDLSVPAGSFPAGQEALLTCTLAGAAPSVGFVRVRVSGGTDAQTRFEEWTDAAPVSPDPVLVIESVEPAYTNALVTVNLLGFGIGATEDEIVLEVAAGDDPGFEGAIVRVPCPDNPLSFGGRYAVSLPGLAWNTAYLVRATATTDRGGSATTPAVAFSTSTPGAPAAAVSHLGTTFSTATWECSVTSPGIGGEEATVTLELSLSGQFDDTLSFPAGSTSGGTLQAVATGLDNGTNYAARVRVTNVWGLETVINADSATTREEPVRLTDPIAVSGSTPTTEILSAWTVDVEPGAEYDVTIRVGAVTVLSSTGNSDTGEFSAEFTGLADWNYTAVFTVESRLNGRSWSRDYPVEFCLGSSRYSVTDLSLYATAADALQMKVGDTAVLPDPAAGETYRVLNTRFASLEENVVTALETGIVGVQLLRNGEVVTTMAILILPDPIGSAGVYVYDETSSTKDLWNRATTWMRVGSADNDSWPHNPDDIAIIPFYDTTGDRYLRHESDLSLGGLYFGNFCDVSARCIIERHSSVGTKTISFERTDGKPVDVKVCPNGTTDRAQRLRFGGYDILLDCVSPVVADSCSCTTNTALNRGFTEYSACTIHIPEGVYYALDGLPGYNINMGPTIGAPKLTGDGMFWKRGMGGLQFSDLPDFTGTLVDSSHGQLNGFNRAAPTFWHGGGGGLNVSIAIAGWVKANSSAYPTVSASGYGWFRTGWDPGYNSDGPHPDIPWNPRKTMFLRGGSYEASSTENGGWGVGVRNPRLYERLDVGAGFSYVGMSERGNSGGHPINYVEYGRLTHADKGTLCVFDPSRRSVAASASSTNTMFVILDRGDLPVGENGYGGCLTGDEYEIIPWMVSPTTTDDSSWRNTMFASFDENGRLTRPVWNNTAVDSAYSEYANAYSWDKDLEIAHDVTLNSLFLNNSGKTKFLGVGRTLSLTSGGLVLCGNKTSIGEEGRGTENGTLVLGGEGRPGYVFARSSNTDQPNQIWATVVAPGGFVSGWPGHLVLGGVQTNILDEVVVNAGTLRLGTAARGCQLTPGIDVRVCAGATLTVPKARSISRTFLRMDGAGDQFGTVDLPDGVEERCRRLYVRNWPAEPEWTCLPPGIYGSSESGADNVRDDLFSGTGTLHVLTDETSTPAMLILR